jgi:hypothetical protein
MKLRTARMGLILIFSPLILLAQSGKIDSVKFFTDTSTLQVTLTTNLGKVIDNKMKNEIIDGRFTFRDGADTLYNEMVRLSSRGQFRKENCYTPSLKVYFKSDKPSQLSPLHSLKLACSCKTGDYYDQLLLKEYLAYKIYNLLTEKSFRVRLMHLNFEDSLKKKKGFGEYAFLIEDADAMAKRNHCKELKDEIRLKTESTDRNQMTLVAIFQYMIGNTDWSVPYNHNVRLIKLKKDTIIRPFPVPYDFDYAGLVNADYAVPSPELGTESVLERSYRGFPRNMAELELVLTPMREKKEEIYAVIRNCAPLSRKNKDEMIGYLEEFFKIVSNNNRIQSVFIDHARTQ